MEHKQSVRATGVKTKSTLIESEQWTLVRLREQAVIRQFRGKLDWQGNLDVMRTETGYTSESPAAANTPTA
jgi:hypothetical protein